MKFCVIYSMFLKRSNILSNKTYSTKAQKCTKTLLHRGPPWKILFFGTDDFALHSLKALCAKLRTGTLIETLGIVTRKGSIVEKFGKNEELPSFSWPLKSEVILNNKYDIGMVVSFGKLIPNDIIQSFPLGCINVHASILPKWRGAAPIIHAIMNGDTETGITIMRIHPHKFDVGEIVRQYRISIESNETALQLETKLGKYGSLLLMECLRDLPRCVEQAVPQPDTDVTYAPKIRSEMSIIVWNRMSARVLYNIHRALKHIYPLTTRWHGNLVKFTEVTLDEVNIFRKTQETNDYDPHKSALAFLNKSTDLQNKKNSFIRDSVENNQFTAGAIEYLKKKKEIKIICCDGNYIIVKKLKISGKSITALDFYNGFLIKRPKDEWFFKT